MPTQDKLIPVEDFLKNIDIETLKQNTIIPQFEVSRPKMPEPILRPNPIHETNKILEAQNEKIDDLSDKLEKANLEISKQTKELYSIHYENMKLNAQIDVLNKTVDSQNDELESLRNINAELKNTNKTLENNNKYAIRNSVFLAIGTGVVLIIIEHWYDIYNFILCLIK